MTFRRIHITGASGPASRRSALPWPTGWMPSVSIPTTSTGFRPRRLIGSSGTSPSASLCSTLPLPMLEDGCFRGRAMHGSGADSFDLVVFHCDADSTAIGSAAPARAHFLAYRLLA